MTRRIGGALVASVFLFALACADGESGDTGSGDNTILPADQTGGAGDMGTGTGTTAPGSGVGVDDTSIIADTAGGAAAP